MQEEVQDQPGQRFPERIGRYELLLGIGTGGMGSVFLGRFEVVSDVYRQVAIKLMHPQFRSEEHFADQLLQEARLAARIRHPNVVEVIEAGQEPQGVYLVMEYVQGDTVAGLIRGSIKADAPLPLPIAGRILHDTLSGLHAAHELQDEEGRPLRVVHRDVSPPNVLVGIDGVSKLTDFGIAKSIRELGGTATGVVKGKVCYMAPEQALGKPVDARCDVWAAGVVAWEMMAGERLFHGSNDAATLLQVVSREPPPRLSEKRPEAGVALDELIAAALQRDVDRRIGDAAEFGRRLTAALEPHGGLADAKEVGRFVEQLAHKRLAKLREQVAEVVALRDRLGHVARSAAGAVARDGLDGTGWDSGQQSDDSRSAPARLEGTAERAACPTEVMAEPAEQALSDARLAVGSSTRRRARVVLAGGALALCAAAGWAVLGPVEQPQTPGPEPPIEPTQTASAAQSIASSPDVSSTAAVPSVRADAERSRLQVRANALLAQVRVGRRPPTVLAAASREVELVLHADDRAQPLKLTAVARDGRRVVVKVAPDQHEVELEFAGLPRHPGPKPTTGIKGPGLVR